MNCSIVELMTKYQNYKKIKENYDQKLGPGGQEQVNATLGMAIGVFITVCVIILVCWIIAIVLLVQNWKILPDWAKVIGFLGVIPVVPGGPILTIIIVLCARQV